MNGSRFPKVLRLIGTFPTATAINGKHVVTQAPPRSGSSFYNYKKTHSIVLLAVCIHKYEFTLVSIGDTGRESDGSVFSASGIGHSLTNNLLNMPLSRALPSSTIELLFVIFGDEAFPLRVNMIKPYACGVLDERKRIFNYRLSRAGRVIEKAFGIMASRFRIFRRPIISSPKKVTPFTKAVVALHNFLIADNGYCPMGLADTDVEEVTGVKTSTDIKVKYQFQE
ncbi:uncharacterized protein LOC135686303 [Rhopilema esculentum]|uniref:uncharacterized protein LOC135686303 n=1 Tax=Rhopilema esculentum TaxID=499914 RepID=UPI0031DB7436